MNQRHRIFIAVNLPENVKKRLVRYQEKYPDFPIKWTKKDNLHITLLFLGYLNNEELLEVCKVVKDVSLKHSSFQIVLNKICYGPLNKIPPKMIWAIGEKSEELTNLRNDLNQLLSSREIIFSSEQKEFSPHITLGRIKQMEWKRIEPEERPFIEEDINLDFEVESIEVMESVLKKTGPEYSILESHDLKL